MKCIILAAGEGLRMRPLTKKTPKPMLKILGKPILEHILEALPLSVTEAILVVGYLRNKIKKHFGAKFHRLRIRYVTQKIKLGTYNALKLCEPFLGAKENFLMLYADDLYGKNDLKKCVVQKHSAILVSEAEDPTRFGVVEVNKNGYITNIEEKPQKPKTKLVSTGVMLLNKDIFQYPAHQHPNGEHYLTDSVAQMIAEGYKFRAVKSDFWLPIAYPEDLKKAETVLKEKLKNSRK